MNQLAENLTTQVRAISEVASAVTKGDLTQMIRVEAKGEVEELKDTINQMIANLKDTTLRNQEQDWFTFSVKFFQIPDAPGTLACPPNLPSTPTSRATLLPGQQIPQGYRSFH